MAEVLMMPHDPTHHPSTKPDRAYMNLPDLQQFLGDVLDYVPSEKTIIQWRQRGCPHLKLSDRCIRYAPEEVLA